MADAQSEADKIRNKRLAKLGGNSTTSNTESKESSAPEGDLSQKPPTTPPQQQHSRTLQSTANSNHDGIPLPSEATTRTPPTKLVPTREVDTTPKINIHQTTNAADNRASPVQRTTPRPVKEETIEAWENRTLAGLFRLNLSGTEKVDSHGSKSYDLPNLRAEMESDGVSLRLNTSNVEQAILEAATASGQPLKYLLACWKRIMRLMRTFRTPSDSDPKYNVAKEAKRLCMSYCIFAATMPDMFQLTPTERSPLAEHLLCDPEDDAGLCHDFLKEAVARFPEDDMAKQALVEAMETISGDLSKMTMNDNFKPYVMALRNYVRHGPLVDALVESELFLPESLEAPQIEQQTLLGPFFRISPLQPEVAVDYFSGAQSRDEAFLRNSQNALRMTLRVHQEELYDIASKIVRNGKEAREKMLDWFALVVNKNHKRRGTFVDEKVVSTDGFMVNITTILDKLCEPFMDSTFSKVDRIDPTYFRRTPRIIIDDETKINADQKMSDDFYANKITDGEVNFITEVFFLTAAAHHYGTEAANSKLSQLKRELKHLAQQLEMMEKERAKFQANPMQLRIFEAHLKKYKDQLQKGQCVVHAIQGVLLDDLSQQRSMSLMRYIIVWLIRLAVPGSTFPQQPISLPLADEQPMVFRCLPEYFIEDIVGNFKFITSNIPQIIVSTQCEELITFCITFLRSSEYIKNPGLKSGLVTILFSGVWPFYGRSKGVLGDLLNSSPFALKNLLHALMKFYIEAESTGASSQFYDKFNIRYEIFKVIQSIWANPVYRENLKIESKVNVDFFVRFVNLMLNDATYVLDEAFSAFKKIHNFQEELEGPEAANMDPTQKQEKEEALQQEQGRAKNYMQLTTETLSMMKMFTDALADAFTTPEVVQRLADMMDYNLDSLVGKKQKEIKVREPTQYGFAPAVLLSDLMTVYLNLANKTSFQLAVARDGRSYKPENFANAVRIMSKTALKSPQDLKAWTDLGNAVAAAKAAEDDEDIPDEDIPEEFQDPLMATIMEDPVTLPMSKTIIDRSTIRQHLLSDPHDPFNRAPLKIEDVLPNDEMKQRINAWRQEYKAKRAAEKQNQASDSMDVDVDVDGSAANVVAGGDTPMHD